ncbi:MAG: hypothetical protein UY02_C0050G0003 [Candidatus Giovannonibacteria bacterium GW2011_GWB1_47_6b]|uniref:Uncharacterized protein n=1 Tax=Candidatus Giovannonibacteria bacterium GW2011_GWB1_47_6b TaxID=1618655 RepID=A0A0G1T170_9BACT|nr:MAG: hypothetical protein UY02_C0050G0003 [Candidatus Giovannonibacteria bacterium GW2011_GWB1_47_6b]
MKRSQKEVLSLALILAVAAPSLALAQPGNLGTLNRTLLDFLNGAIKVLVALTVLVFIFGEGLYSLVCHRLCAYSWHLGSCAILSCRNFWRRRNHNTNCPVYTINMSRMGKFLFACFLFLLLVEPTLVFAQATGVEGTTEDYTGGDSGGSGNLGTLNRTLLDFLNGAIKVLVALTVLVFIFGAIRKRQKMPALLFFGLSSALRSFLAFGELRDSFL